MVYADIMCRPFIWFIKRRGLLCTYYNSKKKKSYLVWHVRAFNLDIFASLRISFNVIICFTHL